MDWQHYISIKISTSTFIGLSLNLEIKIENLSSITRISNQTHTIPHHSFMYQPILCRSPIPYRWRISNRVLHRSLTSSPSLIPHLSFNHSIIIAPSLAIRLIPSRAPIHHLIPIPYPSWVIHLILYRPLIPHQSHDPLSFTHPSPHTLIFHASFTQSLIAHPSLISSPFLIIHPPFT